MGREIDDFSQSRVFKQLDGRFVSPAFRLSRFRQDWRLPPKVWLRPSEHNGQF
jgi:hypothetical protein